MQIYDGDKFTGEISGKRFRRLPFSYLTGGGPDQKAFGELIAKIEESAKSGCQIAIHCLHGNGRTGMAIACLAIRILGLTGQQAIPMTKYYIPLAIETSAQEAFIASFSQIPQAPIKPVIPPSIFEKSIIQLPFEFEEGCIFRTQMPGYQVSKKDIKKDILSIKDKGVTDVILLATDEDCKKHSGVNLKEAYEAEGLNVRHFPIKDFGVPEKQGLEDLINCVLQDLQAGARFAVHCTAGKGRTGLFLACLARKVLGLPAREAIEWVRETIPGAVESTSQKTFIKDFMEEGALSLFTKGLIPLPFGFKNGVIYRSIMPGCYIPGAGENKELAKMTILKEILTLKAEGISRVLMLISEEESLAHLGTNLKEEYVKHGIEVNLFPIKEIDIPDLEGLKASLGWLMEEVAKGKRIAIHCRLGMGRTGLMAACLAKLELGLSSEEAIKWFTDNVPDTFLSFLQKEFIANIDRNLL